MKFKRPVPQGLVTDVAGPKWNACSGRLSGPAVRGLRLTPVNGREATGPFWVGSLLRCGDGGEWRILVLDDVSLGWGEDGWIGVALVKLFDLGGGSASPGIVAGCHQGDIEIS